MLGIVKLVERKTALATYSFFCFAGLFGAAMATWKHGLSEPGELLVCAVLVFLSLVFIGIILRTGLMRTFISRACIVLFLILAWDAVRLFYR